MTGRPKAWPSPTPVHGVWHRFHNDWKVDGPSIHHIWGWIDTDVTLTWKSWSHLSLVRILPSRLSYGGLTLCLPQFNALTTVVSSGTTMSLPSSEYSYLLYDFTVEMKTVENVLLFRWAYPCPPLFTCPRLWKRGHYVYGTIKEGSCWRHDTGCFLATLVALHFTPVSKWLSD